MYRLSDGGKETYIGLWVLQALKYRTPSQYLIRHSVFIVLKRIHSMPTIIQTF